MPLMVVRVSITKFQTALNYHDDYLILTMLRSSFSSSYKKRVSKLSVSEQQHEEYKLSK